MFGIGNFLGFGANYPGGGGAPTFDYYVDSVSGSDSNDGTSEATAFATFDAAKAAVSPGGTISVKRGSSFRAQWNLDKAINLTTYGAGDPVVIDGADEVTDTWTQPDAATYPDVWSVSWTRDSAAPAATETLQFWADDVKQTRQSSLANLQANGGWMADNYTAQTTNIYIKSATNPNSNGVLYEASKRDRAIHWHGTGYTCHVEGPFELKRCHGHYGVLSAGPGSCKKILLRDGTIHHTVSEAEVMEDIVALGMPNYAPYGEFIPLTAYAIDGTGFNPVWKRCFVVGAGATINHSGFYAHASGGTRPASVRVEQSAIINAQNGVRAEADAFTGDGLYIEGCGGTVAITQPTSTVTRSIIRNSVSQGTTRGMFDGGPTDTAAKTRTVTDCVFYLLDLISDPHIRAAYRNGTIAIENNTFFSDSATTVNSTAALNASAATGTDLSLDFNSNVIVRKQSGGVANTAIVTGTLPLDSDKNLWLGYTVVDMSYNAVNYRNLVTAWQPAGYDTNSVHLSQADSLATIRANDFAGDPQAGDFRLADLSGKGAFGDGSALITAGPQTHWDWSARASAAGAPQAWPTVPRTLSDARTYIADPEAWAFYA